MINCLKCNTENITGAKFCASCGNILNHSKNEHNQKNDLNFCPDCGSPLASDASFCAACGTKLGRQCQKCSAINASDAVFCQVCATPLNWICPVCNNLNQAGALYCESCGNNSVVKKSSAKKASYLAVASILIVLIATTVIKWNQLNNDLQHARQNADNNIFETAYMHLADAENNWLPFFNSEKEGAKKYIETKEQDYLNEQQKLDQKEGVKRTASRERKSNYGINSQKEYKIFAVVNFTVYPWSVKDASLSVQAPAGKGVEINNGTSCYISSGATSDIRGVYTFRWSFDSNNNFLLEPDYKTYTGSFTIDGIYGNYTISISSGGIEVNGY